MLIIPMWLKVTFLGRKGPTSFYYRPEHRDWWTLYRGGFLERVTFDDNTPCIENMENLEKAINEIRYVYGDEERWDKYAPIESYCAVISPTNMWVSIRKVPKLRPDDPLPWNQPTKIMSAVKWDNYYRVGYSSYPIDDMNSQMNYIYRPLTPIQPGEIRGLIMDHKRVLGWRRVTMTDQRDGCYKFVITDWKIHSFRDIYASYNPCVKILSREPYGDEILPENPSTEDVATVSSRIFIDPLRGHSYEECWYL